MKTTMAEHHPQSSRLKSSHRKRSGSMNDKEKDKRPPQQSFSKGRRASVDGTCLGLGKLSVSCLSERSSLETTDKRLSVTDKRQTQSSSSKKDISHKDTQLSTRRKSAPSTDLKPILKPGCKQQSVENISSVGSDTKTRTSTQESRCCYRLPVIAQPIRKTVSFKEEELLSSDFGWPRRRFSSPVLQNNSDFDFVTANPLLMGAGKFE